MSDAPKSFHVLLVEGGGQGPIVLETEMEHAGLNNARDRVGRVKIGGSNQRWAIARCEFQSGNRLLFDQMCDGAARHDSDDDGSIF